MKIFDPGHTIGILGSGQLGRMFTLAAKRMGYRVHVFSPDAKSPAGQVADKEFVAAYDDDDAVRDFARSVDLATIEFENIPLPTMHLVAKHVPVRPGSDVLNRIQNRICEKSFLQARGFPVADFWPLQCHKDLSRISADAFPAVVKTAATGYDGKGQKMVRSIDALSEAWRALGKVDCVVEAFIDYESEFSVIAARGVDGKTDCYQPILNQHRNHILDVSMSPSNLPSAASERAIDATCGIANSLDYVGVLCVEFFLLPSGDILINEIAPRPHNSGHLTIEAHATSQFEQQVRSVCGLPLGSTEQLQPAAMANLLGDCWQGGTPDWDSLQRHANVSLHLYGKREARVGRKMGHLTAVARDAQTAANCVHEARQMLNSHSQEEVAVH